MNQNKTYSTRNMSGLQTIDATTISSDEIDVETLRCDKLYTEFLRGDLILDESIIKTSLVPTLGEQLTNKLYVDTAISNIVITENLQDIYNNCASGLKITTNNTIGGISIKASSNTQNLLELLTPTGLSKVIVKGDGNTFLSTTTCIYGIANYTISSGTALYCVNSNLSVNMPVGTYNGENLYRQIEMGGGSQHMIFSHGVSSDNFYAGFYWDDVGVKYQNTMLTLKKNVGLKISSGSDETPYTDTLRVIGTISATGNINGVSPTIFTYLDFTSSGQTQLNNVYNGNNTFNGNKTFSGANSYTNSTFSNSLMINTAIETTSSNFQIVPSKTTGTISIGTAVGSQNINIGNYSSSGNLSLQSQTLSFGTGINTTRIETSSASYNLKNCVAGVYMGNNTGTNLPFVPLFYSITDMSNWTSQSHTSGTTGYTSQSGSAVGSWSSFDQQDVDDIYLVYPQFGLVGYGNTAYSGTIYINFKNNTNNPVIVRPSSINSIKSIEIFYNGNQQLKF